MSGASLILMEDDAELARLLAVELREFGHTVEIAADGRIGLQSLDRDKFDAAIVDRMMPHIDGVMVVHRLREAGHTLPVLILTALGQTIEKVEGLDAGADDYVVKPASGAEIDARIRALLRARGLSSGPGDTLRVGRIVVSPTQFRAWRDEQDLQLTKLELLVLTELARHAGAIVTRAMLLERVWGYDFEPATNIVDVQVRGLRRKLAAAGDEDAIVTMRGAGYMLRA